METGSKVCTSQLFACLSLFFVVAFSPASVFGLSVTVSPTSLSFGNQAQGTSSSVQKVTLKNGQSTAITITSITSNLSDYTQTNNCPSSLAANKNCTISVTFTPAALGSRTATLTVTDTGTNSPQTVSLSGTGILAVSVSPTSLSFGNQPVGLKSAALNVTVTNNQSKSLSITKISSNLSDYTDTTTCPLSPKTLAAGASCSVSVFFTPATTGARNGTLTISDNASNSPTVSLTGTGIIPAVASPSSLTFASQALGTTSAAQTVTLTNNQSTSLSITSITASLSDFPVSSTCPLSPSTLAAGASCTASVSFQPKATGTRSGTLSFADNANNSPQSVSLTGTGIAATLVSIAVTPANPSFALGTTQALKATGTYTDGSTLDLTTSSAWTTTNSSVATVNNQGIATSVAVGNTTVTATSGSISGSTTLNVTPAILVSIAVTPAIPSIPLGTTQQFAATGTFTDGTTQTLTQTVQWSSGTSTVATISNAAGAQGLATSGGTGTSTITATSGSITGSTTLTVTSALLVSIAVTPANPSFALGTTLQLTATGTFTDNSTQDLTTTASWTSASTATATVNKSGLVTSASIGTTTISATSGSVVGTTTLTVTAAQLVSIAINPSASVVPLGVSQQFTATGSYTDGTTQDVTQTGHWSSGVASVATISNSAGTQGSASTLAVGSTTISITYGTVSASATLTVNPAALVSIAISPAAPTISLGTSQQFTATGTYTDGSMQDVTTTVTWSSSSALVAVISNTTGSNGLATSSGEGTATITAAYGSISNTTTLTVGVPSLLSIAIAPVNSSIPLGVTQQFTATGTYTDGSTQDLTASAVWSSSSPGVASIAAGGLATSVSVGVANITATSGATTNSTTLTVNPPALVSIAVTPNLASVAAGLTQQFTASGTYTNGSVANLTNSVTWSSTAPGVATINSAGLATSFVSGATTITASSGAIVASVTLTVTAPALVSIAVTPTNPSIPAGTNQQFTATGTYTDNSTQNLTNSVSWTSTAPAIATISSAGLATGLGVGNATVTATLNSISGSTSLAVAQPTLVSIALTPPNPSFALGTQQALKATGTYSDGSTQDVTSQATWGTANSAVATINNQGNATSVAVGSTTATASVGAISGSTTLNVTPAALVSIAVTPAIPSAALGTTQQFTATGTFTDGSVQDLTQSAQWSSSNSSVATISNAANQNGLATTVATGTTTITATSASISGSTTLTVTSAVLVSLAVTPPNPTIALGTTQQFSATGTYTDGSLVNLTSSVTWTSDTLSTVSINNAGLATSLQSGTANISATSGTISGSTVLTVTAAQLVSIAINPQTVSIPLGLTQQWTATGTYTDGTTQDLTQSGHWSSTNAGVATISNSPGSQGLATTLATGTTTIEISSGTITASATLIVNPASLVSIAITPQAPILPLGTSQQFKATGTYTDGSQQDVTTVVTWTSSSAPVAVISNAAGTNGLATSAGLGTTTITATSGAVSSSTTVTVSQASLTSIAVTPAGIAIALGYTQQFTATATYSDGSTQDITQSATWTSSLSSVAAISSTGLATTYLTGSTQVSAISGSVTGSTTLTVTAAVPVSLTITPVNPSIYTAGTQQFTATLQYSDGTLLDVTNTVTWISSAAGVAGISTAGLATGIAAGSTTIEAIWGSNVITATTSLTVMLPVVTVTPAAASIAISGTQQFASTVVGSSNQTVTWAVDGTPGGSSAAGIGTISATGLYTAPATIGTHTITATAQANSASIGNATVTIGTLVPVASTFFGLHLHLVSSPVPGTMEGTGRIWDSNSALWPNLNTANGTFVWTNLDNVLAAYKTAGINDVLYTLWRVPKWASSQPSDTTCDYASIGPNFTGECDLPTDINADGTGTNLTWRNWVQNIAQHVNDPTYLQTHAKISYWEACNECYRSPTLDPGYGSGGAKVAYYGTYPQLVRLMQDARCIIIGNPSDPITASNTTCGQAGYPVIGIDPSAKMVMPSTNPIQVGKNPPYPQVTQNLLYCTCAGTSCSKSTTGCPTGSAGSAAVDILSVHLYPGSYTPEQIPSEVAIVRSYLNQTDLAKPFWSGEGGWGQNSTATQINDGDPDLEAAWVARFHIMVWASGLQRAYWYEWDNNAYGTLWSSTSINGCSTAFTSGFICKAGTAYQQVHNWLLGSTLTSCSVSGTTWTCGLTQSNGSAAEIIWDTSQTCSNGICTTNQYSTPLNFTKYEDLTGATYSISGSAPVGIKPILLTTQ